MKIGQIVLKLRLSNTQWGNYIAGAKEFTAAVKDGTIRKDGQAWVIPLADSASVNAQDNGINQRITEVFGVIAAIPNDSYQKDQTGLTAYDRVHDARAEVFRALLGWQFDAEAESPISYRSGQLLDSNPAYIWWQWEFQYDVRISHDADGVEASDELLLADGSVSGVKSLEELWKIHAQILDPDADRTGGMPYATYLEELETDIDD